VETNHTVFYAVRSTGQLFDVVASIVSGHERFKSAHKMLAMCQPKGNILNYLRQILLAANVDIPRSHLETTRQRYITLCNQLVKVNLLGMSHPLLAVLKVVDLLKYWHMKYDSECLQASSSQTGS